MIRVECLCLLASPLGVPGRILGFVFARCVGSSRRHPPVTDSEVIEGMERGRKEDVIERRDR